MIMDTIADDSVDIDRLLRADHSLLPASLCLQLLDYQLGLRSNSAALLERMQSYFSHVRVPSCDNAYAEVIAIDRDIVTGSDQR